MLIWGWERELYLGLLSIKPPKLVYINSLTYTLQHSCSPTPTTTLYTNYNWEKSDFNFSNFTSIRQKFTGLSGRQLLFYHLEGQPKSRVVRTTKLFPRSQETTLSHPFLAAGN